MKQFKKLKKYSNIIILSFILIVLIVVTLNISKIQSFFPHASGSTPEMVSVEVKGGVILNGTNPYQSDLSNRFVKGPCPAGTKSRTNSALDVSTSFLGLHFSADWSCTLGGFGFKEGKIPVGEYTAVLTPPTGYSCDEWAYYSNGKSTLADSGHGCDAKIKIGRNVNQVIIVYRIKKKG